MLTAQYMDALKAAYRLPSDYALHHLLRVSVATVRHWRKGRARPDETAALRIAELLQLEPGKVLADLAAERAPSDEVRRAWEHVAQRFTSAALVLLAVILSAVPQATNASSVNGLRADFVAACNAHYAQFIGRVRRLLSALARPLRAALTWRNGSDSRTARAAP